MVPPAQSHSSAPPICDSHVELLNTAREARDATLKQSEQIRTLFGDVSELQSRTDRSLDSLASKLETIVEKLGVKIDNLPAKMSRAIRDHQADCLAARRIANRAVNSQDSNGAIPVADFREPSQVVDIGDQAGRGVRTSGGVPRWVWILGTAIGAAISGGAVHWFSSFQP